MASPKQIIKRIRRIPKKVDPPEPLWKKLKAEHEARIYADEFWARDKKRQQEVAFKKALLRLEEYRNGIRQEKARQEEIAQTRLDNLKKARRKLRRLREKESENE